MGINRRTSMLTSVMLATIFLAIGDCYELCQEDTVSANMGEKGNITLDSDSAWKSCRLTLSTTCKHCRFRLDFEDLQLPFCERDLLAGGKCTLGCDYIYTFEPAYHFTSTRFFGQGVQTLSYTSMSDQVNVVFCHSMHARTIAKGFRIVYTVEEKAERYSGLPFTQGHFSSPNYPSGYAMSNEVFTFEISNIFERGFVQLWFEDWHFANESTLTIDDGGARVVLHGNNPRPFVLSQGRILVVTFDTGETVGDPLTAPTFPFLTYGGFRAAYNFTKLQEWPQKPIEFACGHYYQNVWGGQIEVDTGVCMQGSVIDCVWVINKYVFRNYNDYISLHVSDIVLDSGETLEIRSGNNSMGPLVSVTPFPLEYDDTDAFHIHLRAKCKAERKFRAVFASYGIAREVITATGVHFACPYSHQMICQNNHCVSDSFRCDNLNHCGDMSDELGCNANTPSPCSEHYVCGYGQGRYCSYQHCDGTRDCPDGLDERNCPTFPSPVSPPPGYPDHYYWGVITPIVLICVILGIIACIVISYYMRRKRLIRRRRADRQRHLAANSRVSTVDGNFGRPRYTAIPQEFPALAVPPYDLPPPSYEDTMRLGVTGHGALNVGFRSDSMDLLAQPPAYSPKVGQPLPVQYVVSSDRDRPGGSGAPATPWPQGAPPGGTVAGEADPPPSFPRDPLFVSGGSSLAGMINPATVLQVLNPAASQGWQGPPGNGSHGNGGDGGGGGRVGGGPEGDTSGRDTDGRLAACPSPHHGSHSSSPDSPKSGSDQLKHPYMAAVEAGLLTLEDLPASVAAYLEPATPQPATPLPATPLPGSGNPSPNVKDLLSKASLLDSEPDMMSWDSSFNLGDESRDVDSGSEGIHLPSAGSVYV